VQADRLDAVINLLGELVIAGAGANLLARETRNVALIEANLHMNGLIEEIRNGTLGLRMVPVGETFSRFRRVVRDTASAAWAKKSTLRSWAVRLSSTSPWSRKLPTR
jgi:two-component system chemotaxis sensor kinase CheA